MNGSQPTPDEAHTGALLKPKSSLIPVALIGFGVSVLLIMKVVVPADWDPSVVASFGIEEQTTLDYASSRLDRVVARPSIGHDGRFFFVQANDPFLLHPQENALLLDRPTYRTQRMFYPLLAGLGGLLSPSHVLWGLIGVNVAATGLGTLALAAYAVQHGLSRWFGLAFALNPGLINEITIDGAGTLAFSLVCMSVYLAVRRRWAATALALVLACLTREVMLVAALGVALWCYRNGAKRAGILVALAPVAAVSAWGGYVRWRLGNPSPLEVQEIGVPFVGVLEAIPFWLENPLHLVVGSGVLVCLIAYGIQILRGRRDALAFATFGFACVCVLLTAQVWRAGFDITRAIAPLLTAIVVNPDMRRSRG